MAQELKPYIDPRAEIASASYLLASPKRTPIEKLMESLANQINTSRAGTPIEVGILRQGATLSNAEDMDIRTATQMGEVYFERFEKGKRGWEITCSIDPEGKVPLTAGVETILYGDFNKQG